jgi:hypothetical protein
VEFFGHGDVIIFSIPIPYRECASRIFPSSYNDPDAARHRPICSTSFTHDPKYAYENQLLLALEGELSLAEAPEIEQHLGMSGPGGREFRSGERHEPEQFQAGSGMIRTINFMGTFSNLVSPEVLQEFKIQASSFAPEFGRSSGAQIELITRSGTHLICYGRASRFLAWTTRLTIGGS